jgi:hypothetical protein
MRINFHKSEMISMNLEECAAHEVAHILNCPIGSLPYKYMGVPIHFEKLRWEDAQPLVDKLVKHIAGWRSRLLAYNRRLMLIKTCLASVLGYLLSFIKFPKWASKLIESNMAHCLWNNNEDYHKYHLANWQLVSMEKEYGGLGVPSIRELNLCLLGSWVKRYSIDKEKIWKMLIDFKYNASDPNIFTCSSNGVSNIWKGVL